MATQAEIDAVKANIRAGDYDQARAQLRQGWDELFLDFMADVLENAPRIATVDLAAVDTAGGLFAWENPVSGAIVAQLVLDVTTPTSGACTGDFGVAADGTTLGDNLVDGRDLSASGVFSSIDDPGTNGRAWRRLAAGEWVTGSVASGASAGIVGKAHILYRPS